MRVHTDAGRQNLSSIVSGVLKNNYHINNNNINKRDLYISFPYLTVGSMSCTKQIQLYNEHGAKSVSKQTDRHTNRLKRTRVSLVKQRTKEKKKARTPIKPTLVMRSHLVLDSVLLVVFSCVAEV